ncbi:MAG: sulfurtransferase TusA family protein [Desulfomicrobiaceae bacterium]|jgi:TusA-related sulfurtransferase|nr:sulfurtransferase TusA family protein [Desulfomicrobiaceae bacterium]
MKVDARGLSCPQPVLLVLQAIGEAGSGVIEVLVDTEASCENVTRAAEGRSWSVAVTELPGGEFRLELRK